MPTGAELDAFLARKQGWDLSADWYGTYANTGHVGSRVKSFTNALRIFSSYAGNDALVVGCDVANASIAWHEGVQITLLVEHDGAKVWRASCG